MSEEKKPEEQAKVNDSEPFLGLPILRKPIQASGEELTQLKFREPTAADIEACGNPIIMDVIGHETPKIVFDTKVMTSMMARLAAVPPSSIRQLHSKDWNSAAWVLANFFVPDL